MNARGDAVAFWGPFNGGTAIHGGRWARTFSKDTGWSAPVKLERPAGSVLDLTQATLDDTGAAWVAWRQDSGALAFDVTRDAPTSAMVARFAPGVGWGLAQPLVSEEPGPATTLSLFPDAQGHTLAFWSFTPAGGGAPVLGSRWFR
jgi:hypothetical protein